MMATDCQVPRLADLHAWGSIRRAVGNPMPREAFFLQPSTHLMHLHCIRSQFCILFFWTQDSGTQDINLAYFLPHIEVFLPSSPTSQVKPSRPAFPRSSPYPVPVIHSLRLPLVFGFLLLGYHRFRLLRWWAWVAPTGAFTGRVAWFSP